MSRYIDADALDDSFRDSIVKCKQWFEEASVLREEESTAKAEQAYVTFMECSMRLKKQPTVDAVPVVRCRDCLWRHDDSSTMWLPCMEIKTSDDWFCADGERRANSNET